MKDFTCFVGADWSGAQGEWLPGLKVAIARPGSAAPVLMPGIGPKGRWSRQSFVDAALKFTRTERALIGIDFAFGFPPVPEVDAEHGWPEVEAHCRADPHLYGGAFFRNRSHPFGRYVNGPWGKGEAYRADHLRETEQAAGRTKGAKASTMLNGVGAAGVGFSSTSGMRALLQLRRRAEGRLAIWPFEEPAGEASVAVEIFPRYFALARGCSARVQDPATLDLALAAYGSEPYRGPVGSEDEGDAILSAAALRALASEASLWEGLPEAARREGWIFGVPPA